MGRLERRLDLDLIARVEAGTVHAVKPLKRQKPNRRAETYRGARRNAALRGTIKTKWRGAKPTGAIYRAPVRANRSRRWPAFVGRLYATNAR